jgi:hypothetical protein
VVAWVTSDRDGVIYAVIVRAGALERVNNSSDQYIFVAGPVPE